MKIFYIGDFKKSYSSENYVAHGFEELGCEVKKWQDDTPITIQDILGVIREYAPDFVLFCKGRFYSRGDILIERLRDEGIKTVTWMFDLYFDVPKEMGSNRSVHEPQFSADIVFSSDGGHDEQWKQHGIKHITLRQGIHEPEATYGIKKDSKYDVVFIGSNTYIGRDKLIRALRERYGDRFCHFGRGGNGSEVRGLDLNDLLASVKVVVGDSVPSPNYWSNRIYEVLGRGGFLLHPKVAGLEKEYEYYKHFIPYDHGNHAQVFEIVDYYLTHDKEREAIRKAGHEFTKKNHTYTKRCQKLLEQLTTQ